MTPRQPLIKQLNAALSSKELMELFDEIIRNLPPTFSLYGRQYCKDELALLDRPPRGCCLVLNSHNEILVLFGQVNNEGNYDLVSQLNEQDFNSLIMSQLLKTSSAYFNLVSYNLLPEKEIVKHSKKLNQIPLPRPAKSPVSTVVNPALKDLIKTQQGQLYFQHHLDEYSWQYIEKEISTLDSGSLDFCYLELPHIILAPVFDLFNKTGDSALLRKHLDATILSFPQTNKFFVKLAETCFNKKIALVPVDMVVALESKISEAILITERDEYISENIILKQRCHENAKFIGLFGLRHSNIARILNLPSVAIMPNVTERKEAVITVDECRYSEGLAANFSRVLKRPAVKSKLRSGLYVYGRIPIL